MSRDLMSDVDREDVARFIEEHWGSRVVMSRGMVFHPHKENGFVDRRDGRVVGLITFHIHPDEGLEILTVNSKLEKSGIGTSLMLKAIDHARDVGCPCVFLTTTNDNIPGLAFYQKLGFRIKQVNVGVVDEARRVKPQIPETGFEGIPVHDEIVMSLDIKPYTV